MKKSTKLFALLLSLVMLVCSLPLTGLAADAEEPEEIRYVELKINALQIETGEDDPQTVFRIRLNATSSYRGIRFTDFDETATINIYDQYLSVPRFFTDDVKTEDPVIATAKPVGLDEDGVLTLDVFDKDGNPGAKLICVEVKDVGHLYPFAQLPEGFLSVEDPEDGPVASKNKEVRLTALDESCVKTISSTVMAKFCEARYYRYHSLTPTLSSLLDLTNVAEFFKYVVKQDLWALLLPAAMLNVSLKLEKIYKDAYGISAFETMRAVRSDGLRSTFTGEAFPDVPGLNMVYFLLYVTPIFYPLYVFLNVPGTYMFAA